MVITPGRGSFVTLDLLELANIREWSDFTKRLVRIVPKWSVGEYDRSETHGTGGFGFMPYIISSYVASAWLQGVQSDHRGCISTHPELVIGGGQFGVVPVRVGALEVRKEPGIGVTYGIDEVFCRLGVAEFPSNVGQIPGDAPYRLDARRSYGASQGIYGLVENFRRCTCSGGNEDRHNSEGLPCPEVLERREVQFE
jgi:hypothetical protein